MRNRSVFGELDVIRHELQALEDVTRRLQALALADDPLSNAFRERFIARALGIDAAEALLGEPTADALAPSPDSTEGTAAELPAAEAPLHARSASG